MRKAQGFSPRLDRRAVAAVFLILTALASGDLLEIIPYFAPWVASPWFPFYHETHDLLALMVALYAAHKLSPTVGWAAVAWFLAVHIPYASLVFVQEGPELLRLAVLAGVALFGIRIIAVRYRLEAQLRASAADIEARRAAERRRSDQLDALRATVADISAELDLPRLFQAILGRAVALLDATGGDLGLYEADSGQLLVVASHHMGQDYTGARMKSGEGAMGRAAETSEPVIVRDYQTWEGRSPQYAQGPWHATMATPLLAGGQLVGAIGVVDARPERQFTDSDLQLLNLFARQAAFAIERARLFEAERWQVQELTMLHDIAAVGVEATSVEALIQRAVQIVGDTLRPDYFGVGLVDETAGLLRVCRSTRSVREERLTIPLGVGVAGRVIASGQPLRAPDVSREPAYADVNPGTRSELCVPLKAEGRVIGLINLESTRLDAFSQADERLMMAFAGQLATAIEKVRLYAESERRADQVQALHEASRALTSDLRLGVVLQTLAETARRLTGARYAALLVLDAAGQPAGFHTAGLSEEERRGIGAPPQARGLLGAVLRETVPICVADIARDPRAAGFPPHHPPMKTFMGVPVIARGRVIGSLYLTEKADAQQFTPEDENLVVALAADAAIAIENARLFEEVQRLAITDGLTGLYNRRHFFELAERELERSRRYDRPLSAMMLDIDHFKQVNDTHGHAVGDQVLQALAARFRDNVRDIDLLARYGGEEFVALLPEVGLESARAAAERLRQSVAETPIETAAGPLSVTVSLGVGAIHFGAIHVGAIHVGAIHVGAIHELPVPGAPDCPDLPTLLRLADEALYAAKNAGRNRVATNEPGSVSFGGA